ncbi:MAG: helix-turn-helix domain-containing protein [Deltaproteobacteria bacterium]|nr:helix-turn-helix domain-containing protein [Deltaproteobacteria bacterium]
MTGPFQSLGQAIRIIRKRRGWSQKFWAEKAQISVSGLSRYESGAIEPSISSLDTLLESAGADLIELDEVLKGVRNEVPKVAEPTPEAAEALAARLLETLSPEEESLASDVISLVLKQRERQS